MVAAISLLAGCATAPAPPGQAASDIRFTPGTGFEGRSHGDGSLHLAFAADRDFQVDSEGHARADGGFELVQQVRFEGEPARERTWRLRRDPDGGYRGTLSDAAGPVRGETDGPVLRLRYRLRGPLVMHQVLTLMADGRRIDNVGRITLLGIPVGALHETIVREAPVDRGGDAAAD